MRPLLPSRLTLSFADMVPDRSRFTRSGVALLATILVHLLLLLILLLARSPVQPVKDDRALVTFSVMPDPAREKAGSKAPEKTKRAEKTSTARKTETAAPMPPRPEPVPQAPNPAPAFIPIPKDAFAAGNIANIPRSGGSAGTSGSGANSAAVSGPGEGPGGVQLYEAEWYRRPTDMELAGYLPADRPVNGWGLVACKTIENFHVENCQSLGESPMGSGLARAVRQAAWQFLVRPPRIDGKPQVGAWVRIRIDYTQRQVTEQP